MSYGCKCDCPDFRTHAMGVTLASGSVYAKNINETEAQWSKDGDAYRRLRAQGYQPPDVDGSAKLEQLASDPIEIQSGKIYGKEGVALRKSVAEDLAS